MNLITQSVQVVPFSNLAMRDNNERNRILYHDIAAQIITEPPPCFTVGTEPGILDCRSPWVFSKRKLFLTNVGNSVKDDSYDHNTLVSSCLMSRVYGRDTIVYASEHYFQ
jgi:hypothetical protein